MKRVAIFASGAGSNALNLINYFGDSDSIHICVLYCDNPKAGILEKIEKDQLSVRLITKDEKAKGGANLLIKLGEDRIDFILLAGYLSLIPSEVTKAYPYRILNIHPALLPKYGGKGMYGDRVHGAILLNGERESGITIHYVNEKYDEGDVLFQSKFSIPEGANLNFIKTNISNHEQAYYPLVAETALLLV